VYVNSVSATMQIRTQLNRLFRPDGPAFAVSGNGQVSNACYAVFGNFNARTHSETNTQCFGTSLGYKLNFEAFVATTWAHEGRHMDSALVAARSPAGDLHALVSPFVKQNTTELTALTFGAFYDAYDHVFARSLSSHTGGTDTFGPVVRFVGSPSSWTVATLNVSQ
jgi:hypothetical protein